MAKEMAQISKGLMRERNIKWFPELADKRNLPGNLVYRQSTLIFREKYKSPFVLGNEELRRIS